VRGCSRDAFEIWPAAEPGDLTLAAARDAADHERPTSRARVARKEAYVFLKAQWMTLLTASVLAGMAPANGRLEISAGTQPPGHARRELSIQWRPEAGRAVAIQFNVECAPGWRMEIAPGRDALAAGKQLVSSDLPSGGKRVVIFGMEPLELAAGELAVVVVSPADERPVPVEIGAGAVR
jgi:hypothetical protein